MYFRNKNIFVTGATGLLGSHLVNHLLDGEANIVILYRDEIPRTYLKIEDVTKIRGDLSNVDLLERILHDYQIDYVYHLGAQTQVPVANKNPLEVFEGNIRGTYNLLEACRRYDKLTKIVISSSDKAYGIHNNLPYTEDTPLEGRYPYDCSKSCADLISQSYWHTYNLPVAIARCANLYGEGDFNFARLIPGTIKSILRGHNPTLRGSGQTVRDYLYVEDAVDAFIKLSEALNGEIYNISSELSIKSIDVVYKILEYLQSEMDPIILNEAKNEIPEQTLDASKIKRELRWTNLYTFDKALAKTIHWYVEYLKVEQ